MIGERGRARALYIKGRRGFNDRQHGRPDGALGPHRRHRSSIRSATDARVILADEPTGNLDSAHGAELMDLLRSIVDREHRTLVLVTHDASAAARGDRLVRLRDGKVESHEHQRPSLASETARATCI